jgi:hypothetical protein
MVSDIFIILRKSIKYSFLWVLKILLQLQNNFTKSFFDEKNILNSWLKVLALLIHTEFVVYPIPESLGV